MSQVVSVGMFSGTWCNLVSNAPGGGGCWEVISANLSLLPVTATPSLKGISWAWERAELPSSLVQRGHVSKHGNRGGAKGPVQVVLLLSEATCLPTTPKR